MSVSNPISMFDVAGKVALITGASGAFGAVAAEALSGAGCKLVLAAGNATAMAEVAGRCKGEVVQINARPDSEDACEALVAKAVEAFGRLDILVVASGMNKVALINDMEPSTFEGIMDANVTQSWLMARAAAGQMKAQGEGGRIAWSSSGVHSILRLQGCGRLDHQSAGLRAGADGHYGKCNSANSVPVALDGLDVRR